MSCVQDAGAQAGLRGVRRVYRMSQDADGNMRVESSEHDLEDEVDWFAQARHRRQGLRVQGNRRRPLIAMGAPRLRRDSPAAPGGAGGPGRAGVALGGAGLRCRQQAGSAGRLSVGLGCDCTLWTCPVSA